MEAHLPRHARSWQDPGADWITGRDQVLDIVEAFIDQVIPGERFVVAGISYGGYVGRGLVYRRGPQMDGLLLNVPVIIPDHAKRTLPPRVILFKDQAIMDSAKSENMAWLEEIVVVQNQTVLDYARVMQAGEKLADEKFLDRIWPQGVFSFDVDKLPQPFPAPTLFIMGRQDNVVGYRDASGILENYPRATFAVLDRAGHLASGEQTELCSALVREWLDRVEEWVTQTHSARV